MEGSESEAVFDSFNLNPQLFINEVLNAVDDMVDGAFDFYEQQASELLGNMGSDRSGELNRGVSFVRHMIQAVLDKRLGMWEKYCLRHCFVVPEGFSLPKADSSGNSLLPEDVLSDAELDAQLDSLREKLVVVGRESAELHRELHALQKQSILSSSCARSVAEALEPFKQNSTHDMFKEMLRTASELRAKMEIMKAKRREEMERIRIERIYNPDKSQSMMYSNGLSASLEDLQEFADDMTKRCEHGRCTAFWCIRQSLKNGLEVGRESAELHREVHALQKQSILSSSCARSVAEALEPFKQNSTHDMFKKMLRTASELRAKMEIMKAKRREEMERIRIERIYNPDKSQSMMYSNGLSASLEDLHEFADNMTKRCEHGRCPAFW